MTLANRSWFNQKMTKKQFLWICAQVMLRQVCSESVAADVDKFPPLRRRGVTIRPSYIHRTGKVFL